MFVVHLSLRVAMQNETFCMCHSHSHEVIPIPIGSPKAIPIPMDTSILHVAHCFRLFYCTVIRLLVDLWRPWKPVQRWVTAHVMSVCATFHSNPSAEWRDIASRVIAVNGRTDGRPESTMLYAYSVASQPINWAGQSPGARKVLGAPSNFAELKKHKTTSTIMTCMKAEFHDI